ncbi:MAG: hypothetical protein ABIH28_01975 [archaeon]
MFNQTSEEFKTYFLLEFTRQLIRNSADVEMYKLDRWVNQQEEEKIKLINLELGERKNQVVQEKREIKRFIQKKIQQKEEERYIPSVKAEISEESPVISAQYKGMIKRNLPSRKPFFIPDLALPERLQYLKPLPTYEEIDLGKINNFIRDPVIRVIECNGPNQEIIINGVKGTKETNVLLTKEEIEEIMKKFSAETKIPLQEGFFKAVHGKLILTAIYSESADSKFIIKKMLIPPRRPNFLANQNNYPR